MSILRERNKEGHSNLFYNLMMISLAFFMIYLAFHPTLLISAFQIQMIKDSSNKALLFSFLALVLTGVLGYTRFQNQFKFMYSCFFKPLVKSKDQQARLESFYEDQAQVYDATRHGLLKGRTTMLKLCASRLDNMSFQSQINESNGPIWIDLGGGTGWNIEQMNEYYPISQFEKVYLVDLTPSLCKIAKERFSKKGWTNVHVVCADASNFELPELEQPEGKVHLVTMSYSLSMIDSFYQVVDKAYSLLNKEGFVGVCDFYVSHRNQSNNGLSSELIDRQCNWFTRWFWQIWFDLDHIYLHPCRRDYLEYKFNTIKSVSFRNHFIIPYLIQIPYYIWLGSVKVNNNNNNNNKLQVNDNIINQVKDENKEIQQYNNNNNNQLHTFNLNRIPYNPMRPCHTQFDTYIYAFTWEDPREDLKVLELKDDDEMFVITSAGDNALDYLCHSTIEKIHCIDMNPHQNHLLELKIAAIKNLNYSDFWLLFGEGQHPNFEHLLDVKLSNDLSSLAYQYWKKNHQRFSQMNFFKTGCSGYALNIVNWLISILGLKEAVNQLCNANTIEEQQKIWQKNIRPVILNSWFIKLLDNPIFLWKALGVPINQWNMLLNEGTSYQYMCDTLDPIILRSLFKNDQYFYYLCLQLKYSKESCPSYLMESHFNKLKKSGILNTMRLHTNSIIEVLQSLTPESLTKVILMDHMDWFNEVDAKEEIQQISKTVKKGGYVFWRSSARFPWYNKLFEQFGFKVVPVAVREPGSNIALDRVNMYASFYKAIKL